MFIEFWVAAAVLILPLWGLFGFIILASFGLIEYRGWFDNWPKPKWIYQRIGVNTIGLVALMMLLWLAAFPLLLLNFIKFIFTVGRKD